MPASVLIPVIGTAVSAGASIYAANKGSDAAKSAAATQVASADKAAELQAQTSKDALAYLRERDARSAGYQAPYMSIGNQAATTLARLMGMSGASATPAPAAVAPTSGMKSFLPDGSGGVMMRAPDGSMRRIPSNLVPKFLSAGATVVGGERAGGGAAIRNIQPFSRGGV